MKTLAIRLEDDQHARMNVLAKVSGVTVTDLIRGAIDNRLNELAADPDTAAKARTVLQELEQQVSAEREAIAALIGDGTSTGKQTGTGATSPRSRGKAAAA